MRTRILVAAFLVLFLSLVGLGVYRALHLEAVAYEEREEEVRKKLAFESLTDRLPKGMPFTPTRPLSSESKRFWEGFDSNLANHQENRAQLIKALHEKTRRFFIESPGAGPGRGIRVESDMMDDYFVPTGANQPGHPADFPVSAGEPLSRVQANDDPNDDLNYYHDRGMRDFLYPRGFGYVKDRANVAGFKAHGFRSLDVTNDKSKRWRVHHVQLIGILTQEKPVAYLTDKLPSMDQVRQGKTRPLDLFEEVALPSLREGEDLYIVRKGDTLRMLGALRATKVCQQCHDAEIGDLLGAFSYTLRPAPGAKAD